MRAANRPVAWQPVSDAVPEATSRPPVSRSAATEERGAVLSAHAVFDGTVVTPETAIPSTRFGPGSGATEVALDASGAAPALGAAAATEDAPGAAVGAGPAMEGASGVGAAAAGGSWNATSASWIEPRAVAAPKRSSTARRSVRSTPENALSGIRRPLSTTWRRNEPSDGSSAVP